MTYVLVLSAFALLLRATLAVRESHLSAFFVACALATFTALRGDDVSNDFLVYQDWYRYGIEAEGLLERPPVLESFFLAGIAFSSSMGFPFRVFVWAVAVLAIGLKFYSIQRVAHSGAALWAGACCYLFSDFLLHEFTQLRAGLAIGMFLLSLVYLRERNTRAFLIVTCMGALIHSSSLLGLIAWPLSRWRCGRADLLLLGALLAIATTRLAGISIAAEAVDWLGSLDARLALYVQLADSGQTEAAEPLSIRTGLVWLLIVSSYVMLTRQIQRRSSGSELERTESNRASLLTCLRLIVLGQIALFMFADVKEVAVRTQEFWMACLPLYAAQLAQTRGMKLPSAIVWLWLAATFQNFVFRTPTLVAPYSIGL
jgi:EpsG family